MRFDFIIGNPPFQEQISENDSNRALAKQLFPSFIMESAKVSDNLVLISPSRWFTGDAQDKSFVKLRQFFQENPHIKEMFLYKNAKDVFPNTQIKGGVNFFIYTNDYDGDVKFVSVENNMEAMDIRSLFEEGIDVVVSDKVNISILHKAKNHPAFIPLTSLTTGRNPFGIIGKKEVLEEVSTKEPGKNDVMLRCKANEIRWVNRDKITKGLDKLDKYKVFISKSAGAPHNDNNVIGTPYIGGPNSACTDSLISIGCFESEIEAANLAKYLKTKYARYMIQILKSSQNVTQLVYGYVPLQDFSPQSDIKWERSIRDIDKQLYQKYGLSEQEIEYIESFVNEVE